MAATCFLMFECMREKNPKKEKSSKREVVDIYICIILVDNYAIAVLRPHYRTSMDSGVSFSISPLP